MALLFGAFQTDPQSNCATGFPIHPTVAAFFQTHFPIDVSTARVSLSHALSSNDHTDIHECHAHHTEDRGEGRPANSDHTIYHPEGARVLLQHQRPSAATPGPLYQGSTQPSGRLGVLLSTFVQERLKRDFVYELDGHVPCAARGSTLDLQGRMDHQ